MRRLIFLLLAATLVTHHAFSSENTPSPTPRQTAALQIALDNEGFSTALIDGRMRRRTTLALRLAREAGRTVEPPDEPWESWTIPGDFDKELSPIPESWLARSKLAAMGYGTPLEKIAETFHTSQSFMQSLNSKIQDWTRLPPGATLRVPALHPRKLPKAERLRVSLSDKVILALDAREQMLAAFPCSIAAHKEKRPVGALEVRVLAPNPDYCFDPAIFPDVPEAATLKTKLMIPPGPNNPVGMMWIGLSLKGYGIHGTPWPEDIGKTESHGCFRLTNWDALRLAGMLKIGTPVVVVE